MLVSLLLLPIALVGAAAVASTCCSAAAAGASTAAPAGLPVAASFPLVLFPAAALSLLGGTAGAELFALTAPALPLNFHVAVVLLLLPGSLLLLLQDLLAVLLPLFPEVLFLLLPCHCFPDDVMLPLAGGARLDFNAGAGAAALAAELDCVLLLLLLLLLLPADVCSALPPAFQAPVLPVLLVTCTALLPTSFDSAGGF
jgi:hypothetical protein